MKLLLVIVLHPIDDPCAPLPMPVCIPIYGSQFDDAATDERDPAEAADIATSMLLSLTPDKHSALAHLALQSFLQGHNTRDFAWSDEWAGYARPLLHVSVTPHQGTLRFRAEDFGEPPGESPRVFGDRPLTVAAAPPLRAKPKQLLH